MLKPYKQEIWATLPDTTGVPLEVSLSILRGLHQRWIILFENLSDESWQRVGFHPEIGDVSVDDMLDIYAQHCQDHVQQMTRLFEAEGW